VCERARTCVNLIIFGSSYCFYVSYSTARSANIRLVKFIKLQCSVDQTQHNFSFEICVCVCVCVHLHIYSLIQCVRHEYCRHYQQLDILLLSLEGSNKILLEMSVIFSLKLQYGRHVQSCSNTSSGPGSLISDIALKNVKMQDEEVGEGKVSPVNIVKAYRGSRSISPLILNLHTSWKWVVSFTPRPLYRSERTWYPLSHSGW
jgi:hypothetical protein